MKQIELITCIAVHVGIPGMHHQLNEINAILAYLIKKTLHETIFHLFKIS